MKNCACPAKGKNFSVRKSHYICRENQQECRETWQFFNLPFRQIFFAVRGDVLEEVGEVVDHAWNKIDNFFRTEHSMSEILGGSINYIPFI